MARRSAATAMTSRMALTEARHHLGAVIKRVHRGKEHIILEKGGLPVAALIDIDDYEDLLELHDLGARRDIEISTREFREGKGRPAEELLAELRAADVGQDR